MDNNNIELPTIKETLKKNNVKINKSLGQNFLFDLNLTDKIVRNSEPIAPTVIEIGPGPGSLTRSILISERLRRYRHLNLEHIVEKLK